ncbi:MAG: lysoplasmalogenase family protein [Brachybacterium sp.]|nr:lysoplasmalogenase family protein [Brachybacterium sp.]
MRYRDALVKGAWATFAALTVLHLGVLLAGSAATGHVTRLLVSVALVGAFAVTVRRWTVPLMLIGAGLAVVFIGDLAQIVGGTRTALIEMGVLTTMLALYAAALAPLWLRGWDGLRILVAVPYTGVALGLLLALSRGAGELIVPMALLGAALAAMAFLASGVNPLTWLSGMLFLLAGSVLGMDHFLAGAWVPQALAVTMALFLAAQVLLVVGIVRGVGSAGVVGAPSPAAHG